MLQLRPYQFYIYVVNFASSDPTYGHFHGQKALIDCRFIVGFQAFLDLQARGKGLARRHVFLQHWHTSKFRFTESITLQFTDGCVFLAACAAGDKDEVLRLVKRGADIDTANVDGLTALHQVSP